MRRATLLGALLLVACEATIDAGQRDGGSVHDPDGAPPTIDAYSYPDVLMHDPPDGSICTSGTHEASLTRLPSDIIFILDNSGSMGLEAGWVQDNMNEFSAQIAAGDIDFRVIVLSSYPDNENGICIDPPLGSGGCPDSDTNPPTFLHVDQKIESHDGLNRLLGTHSQWKSSLRPDAAKHIVIVSDDNSNLGALAFDLSLKLLDPTFSDYKFHGIFCHTNCSSSDGVGSVYSTLVGMTGGVSGDLCDQDFAPVFDQLATAVVDELTIPCELEMPEPPEDKEIDPDQVEVELVAAGEDPELLQHVTDSSQCGSGGWYYDDNDAPTRIILCPSTCERVQTLTDANLTINLGCLEDVIPID